LALYSASLFTSIHKSSSSCHSGVQVFKPYWGKPRTPQAPTAAPKPHPPSAFEGRTQSPRKSLDPPLAPLFKILTCLVEKEVNTPRLVAKKPTLDATLIYLPRKLIYTCTCMVYMYLDQHYPSFAPGCGARHFAGGSMQHGVIQSEPNFLIR
jgi:hypothetical protein